MHLCQEQQSSNQMFGSRNHRFLIKENIQHKKVVSHIVHAFKMIKKKNIGTKYYPVDEILQYRVRNDIKECLIKWKGYSVRSNSWQPMTNIIITRRPIIGQANRRRQSKRNSTKRSRKTRRNASVDEYLINGVWSCVPPEDLYKIIISTTISSTYFLRCR